MSTTFLFGALLGAPVLERLVFHEKVLCVDFLNIPVQEETDFFCRLNFLEKLVFTVQNPYRDFPPVLEH